MPVVFLTRHGAGHSVPPHLVNYRANIRALADLGVRDVVAVNVTGSHRPRPAPRRPALPRRLPRPHQAAAGHVLRRLRPGGRRAHRRPRALPPGHPRARSSSRPRPQGSSIRDGGVYACFEGPRFETRAEIRLAALAGADVAGMTGVPEVTLAARGGAAVCRDLPRREPRLGRRATATEPITMDEIDAVLAAPAADGAGGPRRARPHPRHVPRRRRGEAPRMTPAPHRERHATSSPSTTPTGS